MKKKIIISMLVIVALMCLMAISISATAINKDSTVTLNGSFTTEKGSVTNPVVSQKATRLFGILTQITN